MLVHIAHSVCAPNCTLSVHLYTCVRVHIHMETGGQSQVSFLRMPPSHILQFGQGILLARDHWLDVGQYTSRNLLVSASLMLALSVCPHSHQASVSFHAFPAI